MHRTIVCSNPSKPADATLVALDENAWRSLCETEAAHAEKGCGLSFDYYVERFSFAMSRHLVRLPENQREQAILVARVEWGYASREEIEATRDDHFDTGACQHGIDWGCCPAGCDRH